LKQDGYLNINTKYNFVIGIVVSREDKASMNIAQFLTEKWRKEDEIFFHEEKFLVFIDDMHLYHDSIDAELEKKYGIKPEVIIFPSRHKAKAERKTLSVHPIGNYGNADFGGKEKELVLSSPVLMTNALRMLYEKAKGMDYEICFEVTHHGPYLSTPSFFIEVGSTEREWMDMDACKKIAEVLHELNFPPNKKIALGIGGGHYAPRFTDIALKEGISFGHMIPEYHLNSLDKKTAEKMIDATPGVKYAFFHGKGKNYRKIFEDLGLEV